MAADWVVESGVFQINTVLLTVDLRSRLEPVVASVRARFHSASPRALEAVEDHCNGALRSYLLECGIVGVRWRIVARRKANADGVLIYARDPLGRTVPIDLLDEYLAAALCTRARRA